MTSSRSATSLMAGAGTHWLSQVENMLKLFGSAASAERSFRKNFAYSAAKARFVALKRVLLVSTASNQK